MKEIKDLVDVKKENDLFFSKVEPARLKELCATIKACLQNNVSLLELSSMLGISPSQIKAIQNSVIYLETIQTLVADDAEMVRTIARASLPSITKTLVAKAKTGDHKSINLIMKSIGADRPPVSKEDAKTKGYMNALAQLGIKTLAQQNTEKIREAAVSEDFIDTTGEVINEVEIDIDELDDILDDEEGTNEGELKAQLPEDGESEGESDTSGTDGSSDGSDDRRDPKSDIGEDNLDDSEINWDDEEEMPF